MPLTTSKPVVGGNGWTPLVVRFRTAHDRVVEIAVTVSVLLVHQLGLREGEDALGLRGQRFEQHRRLRLELVTDARRIRRRNPSRRRTRSSDRPDRTPGPRDRARAGRARSPARNGPKSKRDAPHCPPGQPASPVHPSPALPPPTHVAGSQVPPGQSPDSLHGAPSLAPPSQAEKMRLRRAMRRMVCGASLEPNSVSSPPGVVGSSFGSKIGARRPPSGVSELRNDGPGSVNGATSVAFNRRGTGTVPWRTRTFSQLNGTRRLPPASTATRNAVAVAGARRQLADAVACVLVRRRQRGEVRERPVRDGGAAAPVVREEIVDARVQPGLTGALRGGDAARQRVGRIRDGDRRRDPRA